MGAQRFATTRWSLVVTASGGNDSSTKVALNELCAIYWFPVYAFARRRGHDDDAAKDLTQGFFLHLVDKNSIAHADAERGRFRTFLLACFKHYAAHEHERNHAAKRGGSAIHLSWDMANAETQLKAVDENQSTPEQLFLQHWAQTVLNQTTATLRKTYEQRGKGALADALLPILSQPDTSIAKAATRLRMTEGAVRVAVHRLRRRFGETLRAIVGETVVDPTDVDAEIRELLALVSA